MFRTTLVLSLVLTGGVLASSNVERRFVLEETTIGQVHSAFRSGDLTCRQLVESYLARIEKYDQQGPSLNAITSVNPDALSEADHLDLLFAEGGLTGPLHCVPVIVKDNIETKGWETNGGSQSLRGFVPERDATAIARLKAAGAIILAKSNMSELALNALNTVNRVHGRTKNAYDPNRVPAGSSGGTAVALAANFGLVGLGTDTGGSVRGPASHAAIVGFRPTMGLTSRTGTIPVDTQSDVVGPMARTVEDVAAVLNVLIGPDDQDPSTDALEALPEMPQMDAFLDAGLDGVRIGVLRQAWEADPLKMDPQIAKAFDRALADLKSMGATIVSSVPLERVAPAPEAEGCHGLKYDLNKFLEEQGNRVKVHSLTEIVRGARYDPSIEENLREMEAGEQDGPGSKACEANAAYREKVAWSLKAAMARARVDVLIYPTWTQQPQLASNIVLEESGQPARFASAAGLPAITVPMGFSADMLPMGLSLMGGSWSDAKLLGIANAYEQATRHRRPPVLAPRIPREFR
ncbi:MAG: amidase [Vicinamibacterales bacterium]